MIENKIETDFSFKRCLTSHSNWPYYLTVAEMGRKSTLRHFSTPRSSAIMDVSDKQHYGCLCGLCNHSHYVPSHDYCRKVISIGIRVWMFD